MNRDALITGAQAASLAGVYRQLVRRWIQLGHLTPAGRNRQGHPLYRAGDVLAAERVTRRSPKSLRNPDRAAA